MIVGEVKEGPARLWLTVSMHHVVEFLRGYLREHWAVLRHAQIKDPTIGVLALLEKWGGATGGAGHPNP